MSDSWVDTVSEILSDAIKSVDEEAIRRALKENGIPCISANVTQVGRMLDEIDTWNATDEAQQRLLAAEEAEED
jgi:hypothetical protein